MKKEQINLGLVMGAISIILFLLIVIADGGFALLSIIGILGYAMAIILPIIFIRKKRKENEGIISFKEAFLLSFIGLAIGGAIASVFSILYVQFIDPEMGERMAYQVVDGMHGFMEGNVPEKQMKEQLMEAEQDTIERFSLMGQIKGYFIGLIVYAVLSAILAAILKKKPEVTTS